MLRSASFRASSMRARSPISVCNERLVLANSAFALLRVPFSDSSSRAFSACRVAFAAASAWFTSPSVRFASFSSRRLVYSSTSTDTLERRISGTTGIET